MQSLCKRLGFPKYDAEKAQDVFTSNICTMASSRLGRATPAVSGYFGGVHLPGISVFRNEGFGSAIRFLRSRHHILNDTARDYIISIPLAGRLVMSQSGSVRYCDPGNFRIVSTSIPFSGYVTGTGLQEGNVELSARVSATTLQQLVPLIDHLSNVPIRLRKGSGNVMKALFETALLEGEHLSEDQARHLGAMLIQSVADAALAAPELDTASKEVQRSSFSRVCEAAEEYVAHNLADSNLNRKAIANYCGVSERYLTSAFGSRSIRLSEMIRESRLQRCREDLLNPVLDHLSIADIATRWGYLDPSSFNKLYKKVFGAAPGAERQTRRRQKMDYAI